MISFGHYHLFYYLYGTSFWQALTANPLSFSFCLYTWKRLSLMTMTCVSISDLYPIHFDAAWWLVAVMLGGGKFQDYLERQNHYWSRHDHRPRQNRNGRLNSFFKDRWCHLDDHYEDIFNYWSLITSSYYYILISLDRAVVCELSGDGCWLMAQRIRAAGISLPN